MKVSTVRKPRAALMRWLKQPPDDSCVMYCSLSVPLATALTPVVRLRTRTASEWTVSLMLAVEMLPLVSVVVVRMNDWSTVAGRMNLRVAGFPEEASAPGIWNMLVIAMG